MSDELFVVDNLTVTLPTSRGPVDVVKNVSFSVGRDETVGIVGESGSGKSMTALAVLGLLPRGARTSGSVRLDGAELLGRSDRDLRSVRGNAISMVFQDPLSSLNPYYTVGLQIEEMYRTHRGGSRKAARRVAIEALERVHIPDAARRVDHYPHQFSGGMRQRVMIAMALCCSPSLLIADEPTTALDVTVQAQILELLARAAVDDRDRDDVHHPRSGGDQLDRPAGAGDAVGGSGRVRDRGAGVLGSAARVHADAAGRRTADR